MSRSWSRHPRRGSSSQTPEWSHLPAPVSGLSSRLRPRPRPGLSSWPGGGTPSETRRPPLRGQVARAHLIEERLEGVVVVPIYQSDIGIRMRQCARGVDARKTPADHDDVGARRASCLGHCPARRRAAATMWRAEMPAASNSSTGVPEPGRPLTARCATRRAGTLASARASSTAPPIPPAG